MRGSGLARFLEPAPPARSAVPVGAEPAEVCDICGAAVGGGHDHLVDTGSRALLCACRACALLFDRPGAAAGRYRLVPSRYVGAAPFSLTGVEWETLQVPVGLAFLFINSELHRWVAFYPSPAGATESVLPLGAWEDVLERNPSAASVAPDVEAVLVRRRGDRFECYIVPIDACYRLVGLVRSRWRGFDGGSEVHALIDGFFDDVAARAARPG